MFRWLTRPVTPPAFGVSLGAIGGIGCGGIALVNAAYGYWWYACAYAVISAGPLWHAYRYLRRQQKAEQGDTPPPAGR